MSADSMREKDALNAPATPTGDAPSRNPAKPLYDFVKGHLLVANNVVAASVFLVGAMDFLAPRLWMAPAIVYSATAALLLSMIAAALMPRLFARLISGFGRSATRADEPLWRKQLWQFCVALLAGVSIVGFASVAKADKGGLAASAIPAVRSLQEAMLGLPRDVADIRTGMGAANAKLDAMAERSADPQRDLASLGYSYDDHGLTQAIQQSDQRAIGLFAKAGYKAQGRVPMLNILNGGQEWSAEAVGRLPRSMFEAKDACDDAGLLRESLREPAGERRAAYTRLCGAAVAG